MGAVAGWSVQVLPSRGCHGQFCWEFSVYRRSGPAAVMSSTMALRVMVACAGSGLHLWGINDHSDLAVDSTFSRRRLGQAQPRSVRRRAGDRPAGSWNRPDAKQWTGDVCSGFGGFFWCFGMLEFPVKELRRRVGGPMMDHGRIQGSTGENLGGFTGKHRGSQGITGKRRGG